MQDLIKRIEAASGPSFALDCAIGQAVRHDRESWPAYTASIDAALTLVPDDPWIEIKGPRKYLNIPTPVPAKWSAEVSRWNHEGQAIGWAATPGTRSLRRSIEGPPAGARGMTATQTEGVTQADIDFVEQLIELCIDGREWSVNRHNAVQLAARHRAAEVERLGEALRGISSIIGNVDHSKGHGPNSAEMRGGMLNDIRDIITAALAGES